MELIKRTMIAYPVLSATEQRDLFIKYSEGDLKAAETLVLSNMRMVSKIVRSFIAYGLPEEDLHQEGLIGLMKSVKTYDLNKGWAFSTWAYKIIKGEICDFVFKNCSLLSGGRRKKDKLLFWNRSKHDTPEKIGLTHADVNEFKIARQPLVPYHIDREFDDIGVSPCDYLTSPDISPESQMEQGSDSNQLRRVLSGLSDNLNDKEHMILSARFLADTPVTLRSIAEKFGVSSSRIQQIEVRLISKIKEAFNRTPS